MKGLRQQTMMFWGLLMLLLTSPGSALAAGGTLADIFFFQSSSIRYATPYGINNNNLVTGEMDPIDLDIRGFVTPDKTFTYPGAIFFVPGATRTIARKANDYGHIVGITLTNDVHAGFYFNGAGFTSFQVPGAESTYALGINNAGQIVGMFEAPGAYDAGFYYDGLGFTTLNVPGAYETVATDINNHGLVSGYAIFLTGTKGFLWDSITRTYTLLEVPGANNTIAWGLNDNGDVVGQANNSGFLFDGTDFIFPLDITGTNITLTRLTDINNDGRLVGFSQDRLGIIKGFSAIDPPQAPLPQTLWLLGSGLLALAGLQRRR